ncbi:hypothetical protein CBR_g37865 [Chara braunii]|uniref:Reverse transcriptase domain-containing protein n=1 Tax=Chara braunii TaxID=69332 RepID=A0A388LP59_CHABU|nr:hypothetical protein CBR_g37865 [Chara braunii]|eukprot:GBG83992.1 hypothetical protein CBR_g37865 [Chara braunii]
MTTIEVRGVICLLKEAKRRIEVGGLITIKDPAETVSFPSKIRRELLLLLTQPWRRKLLWKKENHVLTHMYQATRGFDKSTRQRMRNIISRVLNEKVGTNLRKRHVIRIPYDGRVDRRRIGDIAKGKIGELGMHDSMASIVQRHVRVVWMKKQTIGDVLHNHRDYARSNGSICVCANSPFPLVKGNVRCRLSDLGAPDFLLNARNIPPQRTREVRRGILAAILDGLGEIFRTSGKCLTVHMTDIQDCVREREIAHEGYLQLVQEWKRRLRGLVCMPMGRNPGATHIVCPTVYAKALRDTFWHGGSFKMCTVSADLALTTCRRSYEEGGFKSLRAWRKKGRFGDEYVLPKHKDPARWRPIAPAWNSPSKVRAKKVAKALQCMLDNLARGLHFNTHSSEDAIKRLHGWASRLEEGHGVMSACFDIKNMFAELPHAAILGSLDWMIWMMGEKGYDRVNVNCRGKKPGMGKRNRDGHFPVKLDCIRRWVRYELDHSYSLAEGELIQQIQGIPMGGHTSPSLACILCVHSEAQFMYELGTLRKRVLGLRLMDDVAFFVRFQREKTVTVCQARDIIEKLKGCYPSSLSLERTDDDHGMLSFLGCRILVDQEGPKITTVLQMKNQDCLCEDQPLTFQCIQDFKSYSEKQTKISMIKSYLHRIMRCPNDVTLRDLPVACLRKELRTRHFPVSVIDMTVQSFEWEQG